MAIYQKYIRPDSVDNPNKYNEPECNGSSGWFFRLIFQLGVWLFIGIVLLVILKLCLIILMW